jgi:cell division protein FtsI (penicillin-binding protein 3)
LTHPGWPSPGQQRDAVLEAAPARRGIRWLALVLMGLFAALALRTAFVALGGASAGGPARTGAAAQETAPIRADITDRHGALLATSLQVFELWAEPRWIADPDAAATALQALIGGQAPTLAALLRTDRAAVRLASDLSPTVRAQVHALGLAGLSFRPARRRVYPNLATGGRLLGRLNEAGDPIAGVELGLNARIQEASAAGRPVALSLDVRIQHALEAELAAALARFGAKAGAAIVVDGRSGEVLGMASAPLADPNAPLQGPPLPEMVTGRVYELGSTLKPLTVASALDLGLTRPQERFDTAAPLIVGGQSLRDAKPAAAPVGLGEALARSSNVAIGALALRVGGPRQRQAFAALGLAGPAPLPVGGAETFVLPRASDPATIAANGYGRGPLFTLASLASAYTVFVNQGERVSLTLLAMQPGDPSVRVRVFSPATSTAVMGMLAQAVADGTGARAAAPGLDIAGKTGTSEKLGQDGRYDPDRNLALFAAVFPAHTPRYVMIVALDEPARTPASGGLATGGAVAAPTAGRIAARIAPFLTLGPAPAQGRRRPMQK